MWTSTEPCRAHTETAGNGDGEGSGGADEFMGPDRINELMARSDYVIVAAALTPATRGMVGKEQLACSKEGQVMKRGFGIYVSFGVLLPAVVTCICIRLSSSLSEPRLCMYLYHTSGDHQHGPGPAHRGAGPDRGTKQKKHFHTYT